MMMLDVLIFHFSRHTMTRKVELRSRRRSVKQELTMAHSQEQLGNYHLIRLLGKGGFARVYLGKHIYLNTTAAIKVLNTELSMNEVRRFSIEARFVAQMRHRNIVRVLDFGVEESTPFLIMRLYSD